MSDVSVSAVIEDFDKDDRIYLKNRDGVSLGSVLSVSNVTIAILFDNGAYTSLSADKFSNYAHGEFGKPLDVNNLEKGSIISRLQNGKRIYADITELTPNRKIGYREQGTVFTAFVLASSQRKSLELQMFGWELEP